jgi:AcrR family transcriptional regulator
MNQAAESPRRLTHRGAERRAQILDTATRLFATKGYHPTSVADIIAELGVGKGVFYWYFSSKEELFLELLRTSLRDMRRTQRAAIADEEDPLVRIEKGVRASVLWSAEHRDLFRLFEFAQTDEHFAGSIRAGRRSSVNDAVLHIKEAIAAGRIPDADPERLGWAVLGVSTTLTSQLLIAGDADPDEAADSIVQFCLHGLGA